MTTVACVFVQGHVPFTPDYVTRLHAMVNRWMDRPFRFVCLTDKPWLFRSPIETVPIPTPIKMRGWWSKLRVFQAGAVQGRTLYLDLDTLVVASLAPILDYPAPFALIPHSGAFEGRGGLQVVKRYNSSVMVWDAGKYDWIWEEWTPAVTKRLHGDQDWIGEVCPDAAQMPLSWFPRVSELNGEPPSREAKVVLVKTPKNVEAASRWEWFREAWA